jgi:hypothetical protein
MRNKIEFLLSLPDGRTYSSELGPVVSVKQDLPDLSVNSDNKEIAAAYLESLQPLVNFLERYYEIGVSIGLES